VPQNIFSGFGFGLKRISKKKKSYPPGLGRAHGPDPTRSYPAPGPARPIGHLRPRPPWPAPPPPPRRACRTTGTLPTRLFKWRSSPARAPAAPPPLALAAARAELCAATGVEHRRPSRVSLLWSTNWSKPQPLGVSPCCAGAISPIFIDGGPPECHRHLTTAGRPSPPPPAGFRPSPHVPAVGERSHEFPLSSSTCSAPYPSPSRPELRRFGAG
jgi:hypothetical protein